jgi:NADPH-dependent ferric siderophore reductase
MTETALAATRVRHEAVRRPVTVVAKETVGANGLAITFGGEALAGFTSLGFDDHCKLIVTAPDGVEVKRDFTPRRFDAQANRLTLEFALHEGGAASDWAVAAAIGDGAVIGGPKTSVVVPSGYDWHLLAGDPTAAPAIARRLEELPAGARAFAVLLDPAGDGGRVLGGAAAAEVQWHRHEDDFVAALRALSLPQGQGFVWCAGEAGLMARLRDHFVTERGHPRQALRIAGYWKADESGFHGTIEKGL